MQSFPKLENAQRIDRITDRKPCTSAVPAPFPLAPFLAVTAIRFASSRPMLSTISRPNPTVQATMLAIGSTAVLSGVDNFVGQIAKESGMWQFLMLRSAFALPLLILVARLFRIAWWPTNLGVTALRSLAVSIGLLVYFSALGLLPVAQAGAGLFSAPIWVLIFSTTFLGNRVGVLQIGAVAGGFAGVLMVLQPWEQSLTPLSLFPISAGAIYGLGMLLTKQLCSKEPPLALVFFVFLTMAIISACVLGAMAISNPLADSTNFVLRAWEPISLRLLWLSLLQAMGGLLAVSLITRAYQVGEPSFVAVCEYSFLVFAMAWAYCLWGQTTNSVSLIGMMTIVLAGTVIAVGQRKRERNAQGIHSSQRFKEGHQ